MPTKTFPISIDTQFEASAGYYVNGGTAPQGYVGTPDFGGIWRSYMKFTLDWTGVNSITSAVLHFKTGDYWMGANPSYAIRRVTSSWVETPAGGTPPPSDTTSGQITGSLTGGSGGFHLWYAKDITAIVTAWAPSGIGGGGASNYGIALRSNNEGSPSYGWSVYMRESAYDAYIVLTYDDQHDPYAPTLTSPTSGATLSDPTPTLSFTHSDPDGDPLYAYQLQVDATTGNGTPPDWASPIIDTGLGCVIGKSGNNVNYTCADVFTPGTWYAWRARTWDGLSSNYGPMSNPRYFRINRAPTITSRVPAASALAYIHNMADLAIWTSGGSNARPQVSFVYNDADGNSSLKYRIRVYSASTGGTLLHDTGEVSKVVASGSRITHNIAYGIVNGTEYWWTVEVWDSLGQTSGEAGRTAFKVRWGQGIYEANPGAGSGAWQFSAPSADVNCQQQFLFRSATGTGGGGAGPWKTSIGACTVAAYLQILVRLSTYASGTNPTIDSMTFTYLGSPSSPDRWVWVGGTGEWALDGMVRRFGSQSFRCALDGVTTNNRYIYPYRKTSGDDVPILPDTQYTFSAFVKTDGPLAGGFLKLAIYPAGSLSNPYATSAVPVTDTGSFPDGWQRMTLTFTTPSGINKVRPMVHYTYQAASSDIFWVDAAKLEEGSVASAWTPGFVGDPIVLDSNGLQIDGSAGGIFRARGNSGGVRDTVEVGSHALLFGDDAEVYSAAAAQLSLPGKVSFGTASVSSHSIGLMLGADVELYRGGADILELASGDEIHSASEAWVGVSFQNSWVQYGSGWNPCAYRLDAQGFVHLRGMMSSGTVGSASFTLPAGYRPPYHTVLSTVSNGAAGRVDVNTDGTVVTQAPTSNAWVSLDGLSFKT